MKLSPHGANVVPTVAATIAVSACPKDMRGVTRPDSAADQSGWASTPAPTYATNTAARPMSTCSTRWKLPAQHQRAHDHGAHGHGEIAAHSQQLCAGSDAGELRGGRSQVGDDEGHQGSGAHAHAVPMPDQADQALAGDHPQPGAEVVEHHQCQGREEQHPQQLVAVVGSQHRVRRDAGRVVVGQSGEQSRAQHGEERERAAALGAWACWPLRGEAGHDSSVEE